MIGRMGKAAAFVLAATLAAMPLAAAEAPEGFAFEPDSETIYMGIGCEGEGVCDSTEYWIGLPGDSTVGTIPGPVTPLNEVFYQVEGQALNSTDFPTDSTLAGKEFHIRTDEALTGQVTIAGYLGAGSGVNTTVDVRIDGRNQSTNTAFSLSATSTDHHLPGGDLVLEYSIDLDPDTFEDGDLVRFHNLHLVVRGVNVLSGFVDGQGESFFDVPTYRLVEAEEEDEVEEEDDEEVAEDA